MNKTFKTLLLFGFLFIAALSLSQLEKVSGYTFDFIPKSFSIPTSWKSKQNLQRLDRLSRTLYYVRTSYVEPDRVQPKLMFEEVIKKLSDSIPEVQSIFPSSKTAILLVNGKRKEFDRNVHNLHALKSVTSDALSFTKNHLVTKLRDDELETIAIQGTLSTLDPHSIYLSKENYKETLVGTSGHFGGLGIVIGIRDSKLTIIAPVEDTPAYRAGLQAGDHITKIGKESTSNMLLSDAVKRMRGPINTKVQILSLIHISEPTRPY